MGKHLWPSRPSNLPSFRFTSSQGRRSMRLLEPFELGRVFYHLSQRRGYKSNRKEQSSGKEASGKARRTRPGRSRAVLRNWKRLCAPIRWAEYFASLDPHTQKVRRRWTQPQDVRRTSLPPIWEKQADFHPGDSDRRASSTDQAPAFLSASDQGAIPPDRRMRTRTGRAARSMGNARSATIPRPPKGLTIWKSSSPAR